MELTEELSALLRKNGAELVGIGNMKNVQNCSYPVGISVAISLPVHIIRDLKIAPTNEYYEMYHTLNNKLNRIVTLGAQFLQDNGYKAYGQTTDVVKVNADRVSPIPHKTVATRAGLGWIGKNCLLVTKEYGSAVRLSSLLTDAPLTVNQPYNESFCGNCHLCVDACPAGALKGTLWRLGVKRDTIVDTEVCRDKQLEIMKSATGIEQDLCGKCFAVCAYTQRYIKIQIEKEVQSCQIGIRNYT